MGTTAQQMPEWIATARTALQTRQGETAEEAWEDGYEFPRTCEALVAGQAITWTERVLMLYSGSYAKTLRQGLAQHLATAQAKLWALTSPPSRGNVRS